MHRRTFASAAVALTLSLTFALTFSLEVNCSRSTAGSSVVAGVSF